MNFVMRAAIAVACIACAASVSAQPKEVAMPKGGPSKDELAAAFKERLESADKKIAETLNKPNGDDVCLAWSTLEVKDLIVTSAEVEGSEALVEVVPKLAFTKDFSDIKKEQKCGIKFVQTYPYMADFGALPKKGDEVKSGQAASTQKLNLKKFAGKWRITN